jgi:hypothetical protein
MSNMAAFNQAVVVILARLYDEFPRRIPLRNTTLDPTADEQTQLLYRDTLLFLEREGIIRFGSYSTGQPVFFEQVALTTKGLGILNAMPESLTNPKERKPLGQLLGSALKSGSNEAWKTVISELVKAGLAGLPTLLP